MDVKDFIKSKNISSSDFMDEGIVDLIESLINEYSNINIKKEYITKNNIKYLAKPYNFTLDYKVIDKLIKHILP